MKLALWLALVAVAAAAFPRGAAAQNFTLPSLPYETDAFEPSIDNMTMTFHWTRRAPGGVWEGGLTPATAAA